MDQSMSPGQEEPPARASKPRHASSLRPRRRLPGRRRWFVAAGVLAAFTGMVAPPAQSQDLVAVGHADAFSVPRALAARWAIPALSEGAPRGATTLTAVPASAAGPQPAADTVITGLAANGIPNVALNAYRVAAARMASAKGECGIDWSLLAGIGRIESNHGRYGGAVLGPDGSATPKILGPALDGGQFAYIGDSDGGMYDGDTTHDRAMGPMQFIPTTWRSYAIDADGNGVTDPFNINDAALASANYLCVAGGDLRTEAGQRRAVFAYNHSDEYVAEVLALARAYATGMPVADLPIVGNTSGTVPPPSGFYGAPAAPGPAIGRRDTTTSPPQETVAYAPPQGSAGVAPAQPAATGGEPAGQAPPAQPAGNDGGAAPQPGGAPPASGGQAPPATSAGRPAPAPAPLPVPVPVPVPAPAAPPAPPVIAPPPAPAPPPVIYLPGTTIEAVRGVTCGLPAQPVCPPGTR